MAKFRTLQSHLLLSKEGSIGVFAIMCISTDTPKTPPPQHQANWEVRWPAVLPASSDVEKIFRSCRNLWIFEPHIETRAGM